MEEKSPTQEIGFTLLCRRLLMASVVTERRRGQGRRASGARCNAVFPVRVGIGRRGPAPAGPLAGPLHPWSRVVPPGQTADLHARRSGQRPTVRRPAKSADQSIVRLLADREEEPLTVFTDGFRAYDPLEEHDGFVRESVVHPDGENADGEVQVNSYESHRSLLRPWLSPHRVISKDEQTPYLRALQLRRSLFRKPGNEALKRVVAAALRYRQCTPR